MPLNALYGFKKSLSYKAYKFPIRKNKKNFVVWRLYFVSSLSLVCGEIV